MEISGFYIPLEVVVEIFIHLPEEDIVNCRKVCKHWKYMLGSNSEFWRLSCLNIGLNTEDKKHFTSATSTDSWAQLYSCHQNWRAGKFVEKTVSLHSLIEYSKRVKLDWNPRAILNYLLRGNELFIIMNGGVIIYSIKGKPLMDQVIKIPAPVECSCSLKGFNAGSKYMICARGCGVVYIYSRDESKKFVLQRTLDIWNCGLDCEPEFVCKNWMPLDTLLYKNDKCTSSFIDDNAVVNDGLWNIDLNYDTFSITMKYAGYIITCVIHLSGEKFCCMKSPFGSETCMFWPDLFVFIQNIKQEIVGVKFYNLTTADLIATDLVCAPIKYKKIHLFNLSVNEGFVLLSSKVSPKNTMIVWNRAVNGCKLIQTAESFSSKPVLSEKLILVNFSRYGLARIYDATSCHLIKEITLFEKQNIKCLRFMSSKVLVALLRDKLVAYFINNDSLQVITNNRAIWYSYVLKGNIQYCCFLFREFHPNDHDVGCYTSITIFDFGKPLL